MAAPAARMVFEDETTCEACGGRAHRKALQSTVPGAKPVAVIDCPTCDRSKCQSCKRTVVDRTTRRCPSCRAALQFTA